MLTDIPITISISFVLILIYVLQAINIIKNIPCDKDIKSIFYSNFFHMDIIHLMLNLYSFYILSEVEKNIGSMKFLMLIVFFTLTNVITQFTLYKINPKSSCSIGFSGILYSILIWNLVITEGFDLKMFITIISLVVIPSMLDKNISFSGHIIGAIIGLASGIIWNKFTK